MTGFIPAIGSREVLGKPWRIEGNRELIPHANYRLIYEVLPNQLRVLALVHAARLWPTQN
ncbi:MAG: type II toxin-antitoxin system RelE/ParE family toxin [Betaproteobacteria bacterium]|nr:type II toxin-antitoxin system RelE/ParE family toxin [Betaproteobacteria bacterium]